MFGMFALLVLLLVSRRRGSGIGTYALAFAVSLGLGIVSELLQPFWSTDADPGDVLRDAIGITTFVLGYAALDRKMN